MGIAYSTNAAAIQSYERFIPRAFRPLIVAPLRHWRAWVGLGWSDVVQSYRRTMLGPFWITMNLVIFTTAMTLVYAALFGVPAGEYAGYVVCGMMAWLWVASLLSEVGNTFISNASYIQSMPVDKSIFVWATVFKLLVTFAHNMVVFPILVVAGIVHLSAYTLLIFPALAVMFLLSIPLTAVASVLFARYRDLPRLVGSTVIIILMMTPIFWQPQMMTGWRKAVVYFNPVHYLIEFIRQPLLGKPMGSLDVAVVLGITAFFWILAALVYRRYQSYVVFWV